MKSVSNYDLYQCEKSKDLEKSCDVRNLASCICLTLMAIQIYMETDMLFPLPVNSEVCEFSSFNITFGKFL